MHRLPDTVCSHDGSDLPGGLDLPPGPSRQFHWATKGPTVGFVRRASFGLPFRGTLPVDDPPRFSRRNALAGTDKIDQQLAELGADSPTRLREIVERLLGKGIHTPIFDALLPLAVQLAAERETTRHREFQNQLATHHDFLHRLGVFNGLNPQELTSRLPGAVEHLGSWEFQRLNSPRLVATTRAWDVMRVEDFIGKAFTGGWLSRQEYRDFAQRAVQQLQNSFAHWSPAAASFWWGHQMWLAGGGQGPPSSRELNIFLTHALTRPNSPWVKAPLQM